MIFRLLLLTKERRLKRIFAEASSSVQAELVEAADVENAVRRIREERFEVILADAELPGLSRSSLARSVRTSRLNSQSSIFILTGYMGSPRAAPKPTDGVSMLQKPSSAAVLAPFLQQLRKKVFAERRRSGRFPFRTPVNCVQGVRRFRALSVDLSFEGMLLEAGLNLSMGDTLDVYFHLSPDDRILQTGVRIVRKAAPQRVAVVFENLSNYNHERLNQFLDLHMPGKSSPRGRTSRGL